MLRSGINVVTTGDFLTGTHRPAELPALEEAARQGGATFLGTGFEPGFINVVAGFLTGACPRVHSVKLVETLDCTTYPVQDVWKVLGFGKPPRERVTQLDPDTQRYGLGYFETLDMIATMLGTELDSKDAFVEPAVLTGIWIWAGWTTPPAPSGANAAPIAAIATVARWSSWPSAGP